MMNSTSLVTCNKKRAKIDDDESNSCSPNLPEEIVLENIVVRLSARDLARWGCASKYWYKSILCDSRFASSHFEHNKNKLNLVFNLLNVCINGLSKAYFSSVEQEVKDNESLLSFRLLAELYSAASIELVGNCNGLVCTKLLGNPTADRGQITIVNPTRDESLCFHYLAPPSCCTHLCQGFCFDSLSQQYKVVIIYTAVSRITGDQEFVCMVRTLCAQGTNTNAWRKSVTSTSQIAPLPGLTTTPLMDTRRAATLCGGDLVWMVTNRVSDNFTIDMLLLFDIHEEKIRFISLPTECSLPGTTMITRNEHRYLVIDHHLLEFRGYLCVARSEKIMTPSSKGHRHQYHHRRHRRHHCTGARKSSFCCCGFKVHLFVLKDKGNQVWIKEETFDLQIKEEQGLLPAPFCCYFDSVSTVINIPHTRMLSVCDQLLLYWADGKHLVLYNLQTKYLKAVKCTGRGMDLTDGHIFPYMDYQLHAQAENILSLKSFVPDGETRKFYSAGDF